MYAVLDCLYFAMRKTLWLISSSSANLLFSLNFFTVSRSWVTAPSWPCWSRQKVSPATSIFSKIRGVLVFFFFFLAQVGRAMAVEEESGRNMRAHSHSMRMNGKYAHSLKTSQHNLWVLKGVVNKKPTIKKLPTELPLCSTSSLRQEKK